METQNPPITISTLVNVPVQKAWALWSDPEAIIRWNAASDDWYTPKAKNDLRVGHGFSFTMAAKDGSMSFDFGGTYTKVIEHQEISYDMEDGRSVSVYFSAEGSQTKITETFDPENVNPVEMQRAGWQAILDNFRKFAETH